MDDLANTGASAPADDLRSEIENAFKADTAEPAQGQEQVAPAQVQPQADTTTPATGDRPRDEAGRFVAKPADAVPDAKKAADAAVTTAQQQVTQAIQQPGEQLAQVKPVGPPPGWSIQGKAAFDALPEAVKKDIAKREEEISAGFAKLTEYKGLDSYVEMARSQNTTLPEALERYVAAENALETNPINGMLWLCERYNVHPAQLLEAIGQDQGYQQPGQSADAFAPVMGHIQTLNQRLSQFERAQQQAESQAINGQIGSFAADPANKFFANVKQDMGRLMSVAAQKGQEMTLAQAYEQACWANPEIRALLIKDQIAQDQAAAQRKAEEAKRAAGSLPTGSPIAGGTLAANEPAPTLRAEIERAFEGSRI